MNKYFFDTIKGNIKLAGQALRAQKTRSVLTILGISIGVAVVITILAAGRGLDRFIMAQLETFGSDTINIEVKIPSVGATSAENAFGQAEGVTITTLKDRDISDVIKHPNIAAAYGWVIGQAVVSYQGQIKTVSLFGQGYKTPEVEKFILAEGRMYTEEEENSLSQVAILGPTVKDELFGDDTASGKTIYIKGKPFRVLGALEKRGAVFGMDLDNIIIVPTKTMQKRILGIDYVRSIIAKMKDSSLSKQTVDDLSYIIRANHDITDPNRDDFAIHTMTEAISILGSVVSGITFLLIALVCISLIVGGVGIMNIMYVSVSERVFEIGLRKALGAKNDDILWQFLLESILFTSIGGVVGIMLGALLALLVYVIATANNFNWVYSIPVSSIILSVGFSAFIGVLFGIYPARKASRLNPIEALRKE
ncbi:MAG: ABC transporter permease [Candidatus Magasanikbacteria bacterium]|nr:ABC transporter permease [Candidatus Magasanikbacteria bacterium]